MSTSPGAATPELAREWSEALTGSLARPVSVSFGRARRQVLVARPTSGSWRGPLRVRLNAGFAAAPEEVRGALAAWLAHGRRARRACAVLDAWIAQLGARLSAEPLPQPRLQPRGRVHDLSPVLADLLGSEFDDGSLPSERVPAVGWGRRRASRARHTIQLGSYEAARSLVRLHGVLDQAAVPPSFVRYVLFHELLHAALDPPGQRGPHHPPAFRRREQRYTGFAAAKDWERRNIARLIRSARTGRPLS